MDIKYYFLFIFFIFSCNQKIDTSFNDLHKEFYSFKSNYLKLELNCWLEKSKKFEPRIMANNDSYIWIDFLDSQEIIRHYIFIFKKFPDPFIFTPFSYQGLPDTSALRIYKSRFPEQKLYYMHRENINDKSFMSIKYLQNKLGAKIESIFDSDSLKIAVSTLYYNKFEDDNIDDSLHYDLLKSIDVCKLE